jgi:hypothetical protein
MTNQPTDNVSSPQDGAVDKPAVSRGAFQVEWSEWHAQCADGCCDEYGIEVFVDGRTIGYKPFGDTGDAIEMIAKHFGIDCNVVRRYTDHG